jgi:hypothetical protein
MRPSDDFRRALHVKITNALATAAAVAAAGSVGIIGVPIASADDATTTTIGSQAKLWDGNVVQGRTITDLKASADPIPYPVAGTLWEATATDEAIQGGATPIVSNLNARAKSGQTYRVLFGVATPQGVNPSTLAQGEKTTGKVYFDVTGDTPDSVVYNAGGQDLLVWLQAPPATQAITPYSPVPARGQTSPVPASAPATGAERAPLPGSAPGPPLPTGSSGTPLPTGSSGTPLPAGSAGTPVPSDSSGSSGSQGTPLPAGSQRTRLPAETEGAPLPASVSEAQAAAPAPAGSQGTPASPTTTTMVPLPPAS